MVGYAVMPPWGNQRIEETEIREREREGEDQPRASLALPPGLTPSLSAAATFHLASSALPIRCSDTTYSILTYRLFKESFLSAEYRELMFLSSAIATSRGFISKSRLVINT